MKEIFLSKSLDYQFEKLAAAAISGTLPNSILFSGVDGGASILLALSLAKLMVCSDIAGSRKACNTCQNCLQFNAFNYPDLHLTFPFSKSISKSKDPVCDEFRALFTHELTLSPFLTTERWIGSQETSSSQFLIPVSEARSITKTLSLSGFSNKPRFVFIWQPEKLHNTTANKLLKMIEEPGQNVYFFLITHKPNSVLKTIISRCVSLKTPKNTNLELQQFFGDTPELNTILVTADGSLGRVQDMLNDKDEHTAMTTELILWLRMLYSNKTAEVIDWSEKTAKKTREEIKTFLDFSGMIIEQAMTLNFDAPYQKPFEFQKFKLESFAPYIKPNSQAEILDCLESCKRDIIRNASVKLCLLDCSLQLSKHIGKA